VYLRLNFNERPILNYDHPEIKQSDVAFQITAVEPVHSAHWFEPSPRLGAFLCEGCARSHRRAGGKLANFSRLGRCQALNRLGFDLLQATVYISRSREKASLAEGQH